MMAEPLTVNSRPYPWPWHGKFDPQRTAVLVLRDEAAPTQKETTALLCSLVEMALRIGVTVGDLPSGAHRGAWADYGADFRIERPHLGGFTGTDLDFVLRRHRLTDLIFAGFPFELGADCTMRQANDLGYECLALTDCCSGLAPDTLAGAMASIQMSGGIFGAVAGSASVLDLFAQSNERAIAARGAGS